MDGLDKEWIYHLLSPPPDYWGSKWAGMNFKSKEAARGTRSPQKALTEWISLADAITFAGGTVIVMPPPSDHERRGAYVASVCNMANAGELFTRKENPLFLLSRMNPEEAPLRQDEWKFVQRFMVDELHIPAELSDFIWEGQADLLHLAPGRAIATYGRTRGVRSSPESFLTVQSHLPRNTEIFEVELRYPFFHGDTALAYYTPPFGNYTKHKRVFLYCPEALASSERELLAFVEPFADTILRISEADGRVYAANTLQVNGALIMNHEVSRTTRQSFLDNGFRVVELDFSELFGKGGGGPRCLDNILRSSKPLVCEPEYLYNNCHDAIVNLLPTYPV